MNKLSKFVAACAAVVCAFGAEARTISVGSGGDIATAIAGAQSGDVVELAATTFSPTTAIAIPDGVTVKGQGPDKTKIDGTELTERLFTMASADTKLMGLTVSGITSTKDGVAVKMTDGWIENCTFDQIWASKGLAANGTPPGGAISMTGGTVTNCTFTKCRGYGGGGVYLKGGLVTKCYFEGCRLINWYMGMRAGSAVLVDGGTLRDSEIVRNIVDAGYYNGTGDYGGGAVSVINADSVVERCYIAYNELKDPGDSSHSQWARVAGVGLNAGLVRNCVIVGNTNTRGGDAGKYGGGVYIRGGKFYHNTVVGNWVSGDGTHRSGVLVDAGSPDIRNNIFAFNGPNGTEGGCNVQKGTFTHNIIDNPVDYAGASDNLLFDPQFLDRANGDYRLNVLSQAIDVGAEITDVTDDFVGAVRPQGLAADLGAYEHVPGSDGMQVAVMATVDSIVEGDDISFAARYEGVAEGATVVVRWYLDDPSCEGTSAAEGQTCTFTQVGSGAHTATAAIFVDGATAPAKAGSFAFSALPTTVYVDENGDDDAYPYNSPDQAARTLDAALAALGSRDGATSTVYVAAGNYTGVKSFAFAAPFRLIGAGSDQTFVKGVDASRTAAYLTLTGGCEVKGVAFDGFKTSGSGGTGGVLSIMDGRVEDCSFTNCDAGSTDGGGVWMGGAGLITNCFFSENCARAGAGVFMKGGLTVDCTFTKNRLYKQQYESLGGAAVGMLGGTLRDCRIVGNTPSSGAYSGTYSPYGGGAVSLYGDAAVMENCLVQGNLLEAANHNTPDYCRVAGVFVGKGTVRNCLIIANTNTNTKTAYKDGTGAGVFMIGGKFYHNTVAGNYLKDDTTFRAGIYMENSNKGTPDVQNNIFWDNGTLAMRGGCCVKKGTFVNNIIDNEVKIDGATGNRKEDPQFIDPANADWRVNATSPAVDLGDLVGDITVDIRGRTRPLGKGYDAGAYEYEPGEFGLVYGIDAKTTKIKMDTSIPFTMRVEGLKEGGALVCKWYLDDEELTGVPVAEGLEFEWTEVAAGGHKVTAALYVNGSLTPAGKSTYEFDSLPFEVYVAADGGNVKPYDTPAKAARTFDDAWNGVWKEEGETSIIHVGAGTYTNTASAVMDTPVKLIGAGADKVIFNGKNMRELNLPLFQVNGDDVELSGFTVLACTNNASGRAIRMTGGFVHDCAFVRNSPPRTGQSSLGGDGGAINMSGGHVSNCVFTANCAMEGGALAISGGTAEDCVFTGNDLDNWTYSWGGAAVYLTGGTLRRSTVVGNTVSSGYYQKASGGAVCVNGANAVVDSCVISRNLGKTYGSENTKFYRCAGVCVKNGTVSNCEICYNTNTLEKADFDSVLTGGGVQVDGGKFYHNTVIGNYAQNDNANRSGVYVTGNGDVRNNIFAFNGKTGTEGGCNVAVGTFVNNIIDNDVGYSDASGNLKLDPQFVDLAGGDLRIKATSKAVDLGEDVGVAVDIRGVERPQGAKFDAGAYEYQPGEFGLSYGINASATQFKFGETVDFRLVIDGLAPGDEVVRKWYCDDEEMAGDPSGEGETFVWTSPAAGERKVTAAFFVNGAAEPAGVTTYAFDVLPFEVFVAADGGNVKPYDTPQKAARTFDDAWAGVWKDETVTAVVHVAAGSYTNKTGYVLNTPVRIIGEGADVVSFTGSKDLNALNVPMFKVTTNAVELSGFTVSNCVNSASGKAVWLNGGVVRDCRFVRNTGSEGKGSGNGGAVHQEGGLVTNCVFEGNVAVTGGGLWMSAGEAVDCTLANNTCHNSLNSLSGAAAYLSGGTLRRAHIVGNHVQAGKYSGFSGGAVMVDGANAVVENCVIEKNDTKDCGNADAYFRSAGACMSAGVIRNCLISANTNSIAWRNDGYMTFLNGAGLVLTGGRAYNNTIVGNVLGTGSIVSGGKGAPADDDKPRAGLYLVSGMPVVKNNIVALSERLIQGGESQKGGVFVANGTFAKNVTDNDTGLSDNWFVSVPPFKNAKRGNYRLKGADGVFVNTGDSSVWAGVVDPVDLDGKARIRDKFVDLGCYEKLVNGMAIIVR